MGQILHIASGEFVASHLRSQGTEHVFAFNEAMCEGDAAGDFFSQEFCTKRAEAYGISKEDYRPFSKELTAQLQDTEGLELFFDHDMFCVVNTITLLAFLEEVNFGGEIQFNLIAQDGTAAVLESFSIVLGPFRKIYRQVLVNREPAESGIRHLDAGIRRYLEYKKKDNEIVRYIRENQNLTEEELCRDVMKRFADYGVGDIAIRRMIDDCRSIWI